MSKVNDTHFEYYSLRKAENLQIMSLTSEIGRQKKQTAREELATALKGENLSKIKIAKSRLKETYKANTLAGNGLEKAVAVIAEMEKG
ncbi:MAG: hypothetical protein P8P30_05190 [Rickettsiales bacterium]|nr:hypothetical protein [Rickettsiales bacterium]